MDFKVTRDDSYLEHHGVLGMKWGVRKQETTSDIKKRLDQAKQNKKRTNDEYDDAFHTYHRKSHQAYSLNKQKREANDRRLSNALDAAEKAKKAKSDYKRVKQDYKDKVNSAYKDVQNNTSMGERLIYNSATQRKAAKYIVDNNMSMSEAKKKANSATLRNTAIAFLGAYGAAYLYKVAR